MSKRFFGASAWPTAREVRGSARRWCRPLSHARRGAGAHASPRRARPPRAAPQDDRAFDAVGRNIMDYLLNRDHLKTLDAVRAPRRGSRGAARPTAPPARLYSHARARPRPPLSPRRS